MSVSPDTVLEVENLETQLTTKLGLVKAVDGVSFSLKRGETLGIVGESGSGKSMLALSILQLLPRRGARIVGGRVVLNGTDLLSLDAKAMRQVRGREISMILQDPQTSLNPVFSIGEQVMEAIAVHRRAPRASLMKQVIAALREVRIAAPEQRVASYPHQMSGGMKQRVVGAIGISCRPQVLIADEPTTALDVTIQAQYLRLLKDIQNETQLSIVFITHDFGIVAKMCDRVAVIYAGRVVETGSVREIFRNPAHPYTQALLNSVPSLEEHRERLYSIPGQPPPLWKLPPGCHFSPRCPLAEERCRREYPPMSTPVSDNSTTHRASCWKLGAPGWKTLTS